MAPTKLFTANQTELASPSDLLKAQLNIVSDRLLLLANVNSCSCSLYVVVRPSVCRLSVVCRCRLSFVTFVHPTQPIEIFGNVSAPCNTLVT